MYSAGPSGLQNAPVTKVILITVIGSTLLINYINAKQKGRAETAAISNLSLSPFALTANQFCFRSLGELMAGSILIYSFRIFERLMGSSKYSIFVISSIILSTFVQLGYVVLFKKAGFSGLSTLIFACLVLFYKEIPPTRWFKFFGLSLSDKVMTYALAAQLLLLNTSNTVNAIAGLAAGVLYYTDIFGIKNRRMPKSLVKFCNRWIAPMLNTDSKPASLRPLIEQQQQLQNLRRFQQQQQHFQAPHFQAPPAQPSEENIEMLVAMGFPRNMAIQALQRNNNNLNTATNYLLGQ